MGTSSGSRVLSTRDAPRIAINQLITGKIFIEENRTTGGKIFLTENTSGRMMKVVPRGLRNSGPSKP
jgi:hypothetical protein